MALTIFDFPELDVSGQVFYVPGAANDGGITVGGTRILSPEPGGFAMLEIELSLQTNQFADPTVSWLMSKTNGEVFKIKLKKTPQLLSGKSIGQPNALYDGMVWDNNQPWDGGVPWYFEVSEMTVSGNHLRSSNTFDIDVGDDNAYLKIGHVIGLNNRCHEIDQISYSGNIATVVVKPPLRADLVNGETIVLEPYFLGYIANGSEFKQMYKAANNGHIAPPRIVFKEAIV